MMTGAVVEWRSVEVDRGRLDVLELGTDGGVPVLLIGTALTSDELVPVGRQLAAETGRRVLAVRRRGYGSSGPMHAPGSVAADAADCVALMDALGVERAAVVGVSYSAAVALQLASSWPARVERVAAIEPPPLQAASAAEFRGSCADLVAEHKEHGAERAADRFLSRLVDPNWRLDLERIVPGTASRVETDAEAFYTADLPALLTWDFGPAHAALVRAPVLLVSGEASEPWFEEEIETIRAWFPTASVVGVPLADHSMAFTHPGVIAAVLADFMHEAT